MTFGVVTHGKKELRAFADGAFAAAPDILFELTSRFLNTPGLPATGKRFSVR